ncbi:MAG TPA: hypothetical protein PKG98_11480 [Myxococcota bacterium]|nr:hypothetical protein [Myxococcota bacterium]
MIPVYPRTARPLDLFELAFPEYWVLPVDRADRSWHVVGLFNWGRNEDVAESAPVVEGPRDKTIRWADLGLAPGDSVLMFNVWDRTCEWATGPDWTMTAQPRTGTLLVVHPQSDGPRVVFTTRHLLGGAVEIVDETVTDAGNTLEFSISNPAGHEVTVYIDGPSAPTTVMAPADAVIAAGPCDNVWAITFTPDQPETFVQISFD